MRSRGLASCSRGQAASLPGLFWSGLRAGLLTFGGAYTVIPFLQEDAVSRGAWMTNAQFLDGLALSGLLPAPLIIFSTFVGYVGGGCARRAVQVRLLVPLVICAAGLWGVVSTLLVH